MKNNVSHLVFSGEWKYYLLISLYAFSYLFLCFESYPDEPSSFHLPEQLHFLRGDKSRRFPVNLHAGTEIELLAYYSDCSRVAGSPDDSEADGALFFIFCLLYCAEGSS